MSCECMVLTRCLTYFSDVVQTVRQRLEPVRNLGLVLTGQKRVVKLQLNLGNLQFLLEVGEEGDGCFVSTSC